MSGARRLLAGLGVLGLLAGCASEGADPGPFGAMRAVGLQAIAQIGAQRAAQPAAPAALPRPTRAQIDASDREVIFSAVPARGNGATLVKIGQNGPAATYTTADGTTLSLADGVLIATRGLGEDLMSAEAPSAAALRAGTGSHSRTYYLLGGVDQKRVLRIACALTPGPTSPAEVVGLRVTVRQVTETCTGPAGTVTNQFWFEPDGRIRLSRQWVSPSVGYLEIELLSR